MTSNRVGVFDEAFKSRIQVALNYPELDRKQRRSIWLNFINRLGHITGELIDFEDLRDHVDDLSMHQMNGRQIRNAITTARQLSKFNAQKLASEHVHRAIKVASTFNSYLSKISADVEGSSGSEVPQRSPMTTSKPSLLPGGTLQSKQQMTYQPSASGTSFQVLQQGMPSHYPSVDIADLNMRVQGVCNNLISAYVPAHYAPNE